VHLQHCQDPLSKDIVSMTNGLVGGWGKVGGGVTQIGMGTLLFPLFWNIIYDGLLAMRKGPGVLSVFRQPNCCCPDGCYCGHHQ
jgi:hypothetical protein